MRLSLSGVGETCANFKLDVLSAKKMSTHMKQPGN